MGEEMKNISNLNGSAEKDQKIETLDQFEERLKELKQKVLDKAKDALGNNGVIWWGNEFFIFSKKILKKMERLNAESYISWNVLIGSSVFGDDRKNMKNDFLGEFSIESFYESLLDKLNEIEKNKK